MRSGSVSREERWMFGSRVEESRWRWMKVDEGGWKWMEVDFVPGVNGLRGVGWMRTREQHPLTRL